MKAQLVELMALHARAVDQSVEVSTDGRRLERWADPGALSALERAYAHYDVRDVARALWETIDLFQLLEEETARRLGLEPTSSTTRSSQARRRRRPRSAARGVAVIVRMALALSLALALVAAAAAGAKSEGPVPSTSFAAGRSGRSHDTFTRRMLRGPRR